VTNERRTYLFARHGPAAIEGIDMADDELAMDLNLRTVPVTTEAAIPEVRARGGGALPAVAFGFVELAPCSTALPNTANVAIIAW
jgi:hypothetical protein